MRRDLGLYIDSSISLCNAKDAVKFIPLKLLVLKYVA